MKKLIFLFAFAFIGEQAFSQMYIVTLSQVNAPIGTHVSGCGTLAPVLSKIDPNGNITYTCLSSWYIGQTSDVIGVINQELNNIINQGYKLIETNNGSAQPHNNGFIDGDRINVGTTWYFAIP